MLIVDKPPSIPVHPCGRYRLNSILGILNRELGYKHIHTLHRLDRLTSGLLMFAKTKERAVYMDNLFKERSLQKQYLCRVEGEFPDGEIVVDKPIEVWSYKIGICGVGDNGREATTVFEKLSYNGKSSVVRAKPKHGRMHQIRVHLQYLGHPILNDPLYNDEVSECRSVVSFHHPSARHLLRDQIAEETCGSRIATLMNQILLHRSSVRTKRRAV